MADSLKIKIDGDTSGLESSLSKIGSMATVAIGTAVTAVTGLGVAVTSVGKEFETAFAGTSTMFGDVDVNTANLTDQILALSNATGLASTEITSSLYGALSAGIPVTEDMGEAMSFMESAVKLASAGFTSVDTAVTATASVMNAYGKSLDDVDDIQKVLIQTQNLGITTVDELGSTLSGVTGSAAAFGVSFEQLGASLATVTAQGTPTSQAVTQLNSLLAELGKSGTTASKGLAEAIENTEYAGMNFTQLMEAGVPLNEVLDLMADQAEASGLSLLDMFSSIEAGKIALAMTGDQSAIFADNLAQMATEIDVVDKAYATVTDTLDHQLTTLKESMVNLGIALFQEFAPTLKEVVSIAVTEVQKLLQAFQDGKFDDEINAIKEAMVEVAEIVGDQLPQIIDAGLQLMLALVNGVINNLPAIIDAVSFAFEFFGTILVIVANNIDWLLPLITAMYAGMMTLKVISTISGLFSAFTTILGLFTSGATIATTVSTAFSVVMGALTSPIGIAIVAITALVTILNVLGVDWSAVIDLIKTLMANFVEFVGTAITSVIGFFVNMVSTILSSLGSFVSSFLSALGSFLSSALSSVGEVVTAIVTYFVDGFLSILTAIADFAIQGLAFIGEFTVKALAFIGEFVVNAIAFFVNFGLQILQEIGNTLSALFVLFTTTLANISSAIVTFVTTAISNFIEFATNMVATFKEGFATAVTEVTAFAKNVLGAITDMISSAKSALTDWVSSAFSFGKNFMSGIWDGITSMASWLASKVTSLFSGLFSSATSAFTSSASSASAVTSYGSNDISAVSAVAETPTTMTYAPINDDTTASVMSAYSGVNTLATQQMSRLFGGDGDSQKTTTTTSKTGGNTDESAKTPPIQNNITLEVNGREIAYAVKVAEAETGEDVLPVSLARI